MLIHRRVTPCIFEFAGDAHLYRLVGMGTVRVICDQASLIFFVAAGRYACLLLVQNLVFSLIGQETKRYVELSHDWLHLWRYDFR